MRVIVTGGAGFVGSHLCEHFLERGCDVIAIDNLSTGSNRNVVHLLDNPRFEFCELDIVKPFDIAGDIDVIMQFASPASPPHYLKMPIETLRVGAYGNDNCLN